MKIGLDVPGGNLARNELPTNVDKVLIGYLEFILSGLSSLKEDSLIGLKMLAIREFNAFASTENTRAMLVGSIHAVKTIIIQSFNAEKLAWQIR